MIIKQPTDYSYRKPALFVSVIFLKYNEKTFYFFKIKIKIFFIFICQATFFTCIWETVDRITKIIIIERKVWNLDIT